MNREININEIDGFLIGHDQDMQGATGVTVIICPQGASTGVDVRGGAPGTRETDLLNPTNLVDRVHAVMLAGGSAFGLDGASGIMRYLEEKGIGFDVGVTKVPIVCGAVLFDLTVGDWKTRPDGEMGYRACLNASNQSCPRGNVGAGTGATVGKILGMERAVKGGLGTCALQIGDVKIGAIVAVNCLGDVIDPSDGTVVAACRTDSGPGNTEDILTQSLGEKKNLFAGNTTIGAILTNAELTKAQATKIASMAQNGYARTMRPAHTLFDGDTIFAMGTGEVQADISSLGAIAARVMERAVIAGVRSARDLCGVPSATGGHL